MIKINKISTRILTLAIILSIFGALFPSTVYAATQIRITEIMYDPSGDGSKEFIEFYNGSDTTASIGGWSTFGIDFVFPAGTSLSPGSYIVIARNSAALNASHPSARIAGQYSGKLKGSGELIKLMNSSGTTVSQVSYAYGGSWPSAPRNGGPSLSLVRTIANESSPACWGPSAAQGGSPGTVNSIQAGFGGGCSNVAYAFTPAPSSPAAAASPAQSAPASAQAKAKAAEEAKKQEIKKAEEIKVAKAAEEAKKQEIVAAEKKAVLDAQSVQESTKQNNTTKWILLGALATILLALVVAGYFVRKKMRKKEVQRVLNKKRKKNKAVKASKNG